MIENWDFEKPVVELEKKIEELRKFSQEKDVDLSTEIDNLEKKIKNLKKRNLFFFVPLAENSDFPPPP